MKNRIAILVLLGCAPVFAQERLSIEDAVRRALSSHPLLSAQAQRVAAAGALVDQARLRPNPRVYLQSENWSVSGADPVRISANSDQFAYFTQPFELGGKRQRRTELGQANLRMSSLDEELLGRQISTRVREAYWNAAGAERTLALWNEQLENFRQTVQYHENRVREGALAEADLLRVRLEADRFAVAASSARLEADKARITLLQAMGEDGTRAITLTSALETSAPPPVVEVEQAIEERADVKIVRQEISRASANVRLQSALARPDIEAGFGYKRNLGFNTLIGTVQFNIPVFNKNQGNIQAASNEERAARSTLTAAESQVRAEIAAAQREVESKRRQLTDLLAGSRARAQESTQIADAAYREGGTDLLRLLDVQRLRIDLEVLYAKTLTEYRLSLVMLETALGIPELGVNP